MRPTTATHLYRWLLIGSTLLGWLLRLPLLDRFPFREDEAIYSYWAIHFWQVDPFFLQVWPDKPPVFIALLAAFFRLFGVNQTSAQWLNIAISSLTIPLLAAIARRSGGQRAGAIAGLAFALNPFAISFAATAYTDPLLVLAGLLAFYFALTHRPFWAGLWLALAIMTKQQGVLYIPLVVGALFTQLGQKPTKLSNPQIASPTPSFTIYHSPFTIHHLPFTIYHSPFTIYHLPFTIYHSLSFLLGLAVLTLPILYWDSLRWAVAPSPWDLSLRHYGALTLLPPSQWPDRLTTWLPIAWHLTASWLVWGGLLILLLVYGRRFWSGSDDAERQQSIPTQSVATGNHLVTHSAGSGQALSPSGACFSSSSMSSPASNPGIAICCRSRRCWR